MKTFVLVHGAWMGAWAWAHVAAGLCARQAKVVVVELPAHGDDATPLEAANLPAYVERVTAAVDAEPDAVTLVGHSMAGMIVTQVAQDRPEKIARLVYLAAYLPASGQKLLDLAMTDADSHSGRALQVDERGGRADIPLAALADCFAADGDPETIALLTKHYRPEPLAGFVGTVTTTAEAWGRVAKSYFFTRDDRAVSYALQQRMTKGVALASSVTFATGHAPFLTRPGEVIEALVGL